MHCNNSEAATFTSQINHMLERGRFGGKACAVSGQNRRCTKNIAATLLETIHIIRRHICRHFGCYYHYKKLWLTISYQNIFVYFEIDDAIVRHCLFLHSYLLINRDPGLSQSAIL